MMGFKKPPKYQCTSCGRMFKWRSSRDKHILRNRCPALRKQNKGKNNELSLQQEPEEELVTIRQLDQEYDPKPTTMTVPHLLTNEYDYHYPELSGGNRHLRCGLPFQSDPLRRTIVRPVLPKPIASIGTALLRLSQHRKQAI